MEIDEVLIQMQPPDASDGTWRMVGHVKSGGDLMGGKITFGEGKPTAHEIHARLNDMAHAILRTIEDNFMAKPEGYAGIGT